MFEKIIENVREKTPLIHCITNYVTVNDVANILLASGASPIMADDEKDAVDITSICSGLDINIGTLNARTIKTMLKTGIRANALNHPIVLDPVGAGASKLRTSTTFKLIKSIHFDVIRGNISEIKTVYTGSGKTSGVDANVLDVVTENNLKDSVEFAKKLANNLQTIIAITGAIDIVTDGKKSYVIRNGNAMMSKITGSGCMLTALVAAFICANPEKKLEATACAVSAMGICGQKAYERVKENSSLGTGSFRTFLIDEMSLISDKTFEEMNKVELF